MSTLLYVLLAFTPYWYALVPTAFASVICFFMVNSAFADKKKFNTGFTVIGVVLGLLAIFFIYMTAKTSN